VPRPRAATTAPGPLCTGTSSLTTALFGRDAMILFDASQPRNRPELSASPVCAVGHAGRSRASADRLTIRRSRPNCRTTHRRSSPLLRGFDEWRACCSSTSLIAGVRGASIHAPRRTLVSHAGVRAWPDRTNALGYTRMRSDGRRRAVRRLADHQHEERPLERLMPGVLSNRAAVYIGAEPGRGPRRPQERLKRRRCA
jgi:hypothetical protein